MPLGTQAMNRFGKFLSNRIKGKAEVNRRQLEYRSLPNSSFLFYPLIILHWDNENCATDIRANNVKVCRSGDVF